MDVGDFYSENTEIENVMNYDCVTVLDAIKMADEAWDHGATFDVDANLLSRISSTSVVKIIQSNTVSVEGHQMYLLWGLVEVDDLDFEIPIRFYALVDSFGCAVFKHKTIEPERSYDLSAYARVLEETEEKNWEMILNEW